jgi:hypothetical protein
VINNNFYNIIVIDGRIYNNNNKTKILIIIIMDGKGKPEMAERWDPENKKGL